jgi:Acetyltransferase (GNAT) family
MGMTTRILPADEWGRLAGTDLDPMWRQFNPEFYRVIVAEDEGRVVGHCVVFTWVHLDGAWSDPAYRKSGAVWRALLRTAGEVAKEAGVEALIAGSNTDEMSGYLGRLGGTQLPASFFVVPMRGCFQKE